MAKDTDEKRCLEFILEYFNDAKAKKWIQSRESLTTLSGYELAKKFTVDIFREIWPDFEAIPFSDNEYVHLFNA